MCGAGEAHRSGIAAPARVGQAVQVAGEERLVEGREVGRVGPTPLNEPCEFHPLLDVSGNLVWGREAWHLGQLFTLQPCGEGAERNHARVAGAMGALADLFGHRFGVEYRIGIGRAAESRDAAGGGAGVVSRLKISLSLSERIMNSPGIRVRFFPIISSTRSLSLSGSKGTIS